jgi:hypothetical protein
MAMVLCMSMPLSFSGKLAVLGVEGAQAKKGLHEAFRQPCRRSTLVQAVQATDTHHSRELRPRYKSLAHGTCEFRSDSLVVIAQVCLKTGRELSAVC